MSRTVAEIADEALQLPQQDKFALARILLDSAEVSDQSVQRAWETEIANRIAAIDSGAVTGIPLSEVLQKAEQRLRKK